MSYEDEYAGFSGFCRWFWEYRGDVDVFFARLRGPDKRIGGFYMYYDGPKYGIDLYWLAISFDAPYRRGSIANRLWYKPALVLIALSATLYLIL